MTMRDDEYEDDAKYAALEAEMAEDDGPSWLNPTPSDDDGPGGAAAEADYPRGDRAERNDDGGQVDDTEAIERAQLVADQWEHELREQQHRAQQYRRPDIYEDPIGHLQSMQAEMQQARSQQQYKEFVGTVEAAENVVRAQVPDYNAAVEFLEKGRRAELAQMYNDRDPQAHLIARQQGFRTPAELRNAIFIQDAQTVAGNAVRAGKNPALEYYRLAEARGYQPKGGRSSRSSGGRASGGRAGGGGISAGSISKLTDLYAKDPAEFDRQWDRMAKTGSLG